MGAVSNLLEQIYRTPPKRVMSKPLRVIYYCLAAVGAGFLIAAGCGLDPLLCQIGATIGILGMVFIGIITGLRYKKKDYILRGSLLRDIVIGLAWIGLLYYWIRHPEMQ